MIYIIYIILLVIRNYLAYRSIRESRRLGKIKEDNTKAIRELTMVYKSLKKEVDDDVKSIETM